MMKAGDPRARCQQLLEHMPVHLSAHLEGWSGLEVRGAQLSWTEEAASPGPDSPQLKGFTSFMAA